MLVSLCKPSNIWSCVTSIGTCLLFLLQGEFFDGKVKEVTHDTKLRFLPKDLVCLSSSQFTSEDQGQARKRLHYRNLTNFTCCMLCTLTLLHQTCALLHERSVGSSLDPLTFDVPPDKYHNTNSKSQINLLIALNNTTEEDLMVFDSDSSHLHLDSCVTASLTGFKSDFIEGSCAEVTERSSDTKTGKAVIIEEGISTCTLKTTWENSAP